VIWKIGMVYPIVMIGFMLMRRGPVGKFRKAGALSEATARRPESIALTMAEREQLHAAARAGVLIRLEDGRYYVDEARYIRRRTSMLIAFALVLAALTAMMLWLWLRAS
jgi:hypothetical protein